MKIISDLNIRERHLLARSLFHFNVFLSDEFHKAQEERDEKESKKNVEIMQEDKAKASHTASPKAAEVEPEENPNLPTQKDMAPNTKKALDMHRKGEKRDYPADKNPKGTEKMKQAAKPKTLKDIRR